MTLECLPGKQSVPAGLQLHVYVRPKWITLLYGHRTHKSSWQGPLNLDTRIASPQEENPKLKVKSRNAQKGYKTSNQVYPTLLLYEYRKSILYVFLYAYWLC